MIINLDIHNFCESQKNMFYMDCTHIHKCYFKTKDLVDIKHSIKQYIKEPVVKHIPERKALSEKKSNQHIKK